MLAFFNLGVINSHSTGIGGGGFMLVYTKAKEEGAVIDFREAAPGGANPGLFRGDPNKGIRGLLLHCLRNTFHACSFIRPRLSGFRLDIF